MVAIDHETYQEQVQVMLFYTTVLYYYSTQSVYIAIAPTIFDDVLFERTAHAQMGHHARKSRKARENNVR